MAYISKVGGADEVGICMPVWILFVVNAMIGAITNHSQSAKDIDPYFKCVCGLPATKNRYAFCRMGWVNQESEWTTPFLFLLWIEFESTSSWSAGRRITTRLPPLFAITLRPTDCWKLCAGYTAIYCCTIRRILNAFYGVGFCKQVAHAHAQVYRHASSDRWRAVRKLDFVVYDSAAGYIACFDVDGRQTLLL